MQLQGHELHEHGTCRGELAEPAGTMSAASLGSALGLGWHTRKWMDSVEVTDETLRGLGQAIALRSCEAERQFADSSYAEIAVQVAFASRRGQLPGASKRQPRFEGSALGRFFRLIGALFVRLADNPDEPPGANRCYNFGIPSLRSPEMSLPNKTEGQYQISNFLRAKRECPGAISSGLATRQ
jgi:hypothetical protein